MHEHAFPMRWADLDQLNHVNNVVYLDYAAEARAILADEGVIGDDSGVVTITVRFLRPLMLSRQPVVVRSTVEQDVLRQEIVAGRSSRTFAELVTVFGTREPGSRREGFAELPVTIRRSDLDRSGSVRPVKLFELFQEARILSVSTHLRSMTPGSFVVGSSSVTLRAPIGWRREPYVAHTWVSRVGRASFEVQCQITDGDVVLAESSTVLVGFDVTTQASRPFADDERAQLQALLSD